MITGLNASNDQFVTSVDNLQSALNTAENELSTGFRVNQASDDPWRGGRYLRGPGQSFQRHSNHPELNAVQAQVNAGDTSVQTAVQLLQNASSLGSQGASTNITQSQLTFARPRRFKACYPN